VLALLAAVAATGLGETAAAGVLALVGAHLVGAWVVLGRRARRSAERLQQVERDAEAKRAEAGRQADRLRALEDEVRAAADAFGLGALPGESDFARAASELGHQLERRRRLDQQIEAAEAQRQDAEKRQQEVERLDQALETAKQEQARLRDDWGAWKRARGFPDELTPQGVLDFAGQLRDAQNALQHKRTLERKLEQLREAVAAWEDSAREIVRARGGPAEASGDALIDAFNASAEAIQAEQDAYQQVREVESAVLREAGNDGDRAAELRRTLADGDAQAWTDERSQLDSYLTAQQQARDEALRQAQEAVRDRQAVETSDRIAELEIRRNQLAAEVADVYRRWQVYTAARILIEQTLERFERERQPAVFARASERLAAFSHGRYTAIRQAGEQGQEFAVIDAEGRTVQPIDLSRGTREQLYLAVRLGLIEEFAQRGTSLPLVLDEILVNFDPDRMAAVAAELARFAEDHQVLLFTCHPEIAERVQANAPGAASIPMTELAAG
jgi:uncharacterized protein YhaN